ncbi:shieldin complex subunit 1 isoform X2 [Ciconia boyciana]|uniref:shieldin complex subunit 1 isoform X2 n=1 Tax=Ciconia boyciana TaxID=52775 RepID=UPI003B9F1970
MKEEGGDPEMVTDCLLPDSVQGDYFCISTLPSGTMEGKEMSPSRHSEESSILDLPSVCDLAEHFLPPHSSENSEELFRSVDTFPSLPTAFRQK